MTVAGHAPARTRAAASGGGAGGIAGRGPGGYAAPRARAGLPPSAVLAAVGAGAVAVIALWWENTPYVASLADWITNAGRITGLLAGYGIAVLVALMARVPALERGVGSDRLARWHARGGRYTVGLAVAHTLLTIWGYALPARTGPVDQAVTLILSYPEVLEATVAVLLLVGVGAVSARAARRRLRYETWYYLHFYTYLAAYLGFGHVLVNGQEFVGSRLAQVAWYALYLGVAALVAWFRLLAPIRQAVRHRLRVAAVVPEGPGVVSVYITGRRLGRLRAEAGQFFRWRFLARGLWWTATPYSLSAPPDGRSLRITVKELGDHSGALARLRPGTRVVAEGPYGAFTAARRRRERVLLIAGGVGITPIRALLESLPARPGDLTLLYRARTYDDLVLRAELEAIAEARGVRLRYCVGGREEVGEPFTAETLASLVPGLRDHDVYLCGPAGMTAAAVRALRAAGVPRRRVHHESFEF
ncbi:ferredoxin reductase family protein [Thermopolyspora sp. NPDC052614]|uniref:ferredoxin reductase family protein n=1 Tax=Thermopolyspora sp. NPDC052614 TaxID=3155682 RepID=UPI003447C3B5